MNFSLHYTSGLRVLIYPLIIAGILGLLPFSTLEGNCEEVLDELQMVKSLKHKYKGAIVHLSTPVTDHKNHESPPVTGTGFIISEEGYVITANHVIPTKSPETYKTVGKTQVHIGGRHGQVLQATAEDRIPEHDLALLKIEQPLPKLTKVQIGNPNLIVDTEADFVYWAGFPGSEDLFIKKGRLQSLVSEENKSKWAAAIDGTEGDSGGPVFFKSEVVAVAQEGYETTQQNKLLAPIVYADKFFEELKLWPPWKGRQKTIEKLAARDQYLTDLMLSDTPVKSEVDLNELFVIRELRNNKDESVRIYRHTLFDVAASLYLLKKHFSTNDFTSALDALDRGEAAPAVKLLEKVAVMQESDAGEASYRLGSVAEINVEYTKALHWYEAALYKPTPQARYFDAAAAMAHKIGEQRKALEWAKEAVRLRKSKTKKEGPDYAIALCTVGQFLIESDPKSAVKNCEEAVSILRKHQGQDIGIAEAYDNIGAGYEFGGDPIKAEQAYRKALDISERAAALPGGLEAKKTFGNINNNLAGLYRSTGRHKDSLSLTAKAISINEAVYGKDHPRLGIDLVGLGNTYLARGDYDMAKESYDKAYDLLSSAMGRKNRLVGAALMYMAPLAFIQKKDKEANAIATDALEIFQGVFGVGSSVYEMQVRMILGEIKSIEGKYKEALAELDRSEKIMKSWNNTRIDDIFRICLLRAATHLRQSKLNEASTYLKKAQEIARHKYYRDNPSNPILGEYSLLEGKFYSKRNRPLPAEKAFEKAQHIFKISLGLTHPKRGEALAELANVQNMQNQDASLNTRALAQQILAAQPDVRTVTAIDLTL